MQITLPARLYGCPDAWARERSAVFGRAWLFLGHEDEALRPGDWIATDIAGHQLLVVRDKDGVLRAFHNVCLHRGRKFLGSIKNLHLFKLFFFHYILFKLFLIA